MKYMTYIFLVFAIVGFIIYDGRKHFWKKNK